MAGLCLAALAAVPCASMAQQSDPALEKQLEAVHAYVARTREWSREDYTLKEIPAETQKSSEPMPTFQVTLVSQRVTPVKHGGQFEVYLDRRSYEVVGEHTALPAAVRDDT